MSPTRQPSKGLLKYTGHGSRLVRDVYDNGHVDDWVNVQVHEGVEGWKKGLLFIRIATWIEGKPALYSLQCLRRPTQEVVAVAFSNEGRGAVWQEMFTILRAKGIAPEDAEEFKDSEDVIVLTTE
jgi:hypothetical protein